MWKYAPLIIPLHFRYSTQEDYKRKENHLFSNQNVYVDWNLSLKYEVTKKSKSKKREQLILVYNKTALLLDPWIP